MALEPEYEALVCQRWSQTIGAMHSDGSGYVVPAAGSAGAYLRVGGPQLIGSSLVALSESIDITTLHSLKAQFVYLGDPDRPLRLTITSLRDTRNFTTRQVRVTQDERECAILTFSFTPQWEGLGYQTVSAPEFEDPDTVPEPWQAYGGRRAFSLPAEVRVRVLEGQPAIRWYIRALDSFPSEARDRAALFAAMTDGPITSTALRYFDLPRGSQASLDHQVWFHRRFRWNSWMRGEGWSEVASGNRAMVHGRLWDEDGQLVATIAQEVSYRPPTAS